MVTAEEIDAAVDVLKQYGAQRVFLFGSAVETPESANDIDLACEGIPASAFYSAAGALLSRLRRDVDLIDLADNPRFSRLILRRARLLYECK